MHPLCVSCALFWCQGSKACGVSTGPWSGGSVWVVAALTSTLQTLARQLSISALSESTRWVLNLVCDLPHMHAAELFSSLKEGRLHCFLHYVYESAV